jgi:hypothetical protein
MYIAGGPIAGTNETITGSYGLWNVGQTRLDDALTINSGIDATSATNGGAFTSAGGGAFAGKLISGSSISALTFGSGNNFTPTGSMHLRNAANPTINNFIIEAGIAADGSNIGWSAINFNGYYSGGDQRINTGKNRWRLVVNQTSSNDQVVMDTWNGTTSTSIYTITTSGLFNINGTLGVGNTTASTSANTGAFTLTGGIGISNTTDATSATNGGGLTCAGGGAFAKSLWLGNSLNIINTGAGGPNVLISRMLTPSLANGNYVEMHIGVTESNFNTGIINFNYVSAGSSGYGGNSLGLGLYGGLNLMQIYSDSVKINGPLTFNMSGTGLANPISMLAPSLSTGNHVEIYFGVAENPMNCGVMQFSYVGSGTGGSSGNNLGFGFWYNNNIMQLYQSGLVINGSLSKSSGSFDIPHPDPAKQNRKYRLRHCFVESNTRGDNLYRYTVVTSECKAEIQLPDYFKYLNENPQVFITAVGILAMYEGYVDNELEKVHITVSVDGTYNVLIVGTRKDRLAVEHFDPLGVEYIKNED